MKHTLTLANAPWLAIDVHRIERVDYPPLDIDPEPLHLPKALCVVMKNGGELWSAGDRSWRERQRQETIDAARWNLINAEREYNEAVS